MGPFSDTDRLNRNLETGFEYEESPDAYGGVKRIGQETFLGYTTRWDERAFDFQAPTRFHVERVFMNGPGSHYHVDLLLTPQSKGTQISYAITIWPTGLLTRPVIVARFSPQKKRISRCFNQMIALLAGEPNRYDPKPPPLSPMAQTKLENAKRHFESSVFAETLIDHLKHAPLAEQDRWLRSPWPKNGT